MESVFFSNLELLRNKYNFPSIKNDIGKFFNFLVKSHNSKIIFEFGSGYGHSCFWYFIGNNTSIEKVYLNELKEVYEPEFESLNWPDSWKKKIDYFSGNAFDKLEKVDSVDFLLIDGQKSDYFKFIEKALPRLNPNALVLVDNAFWYGSVLNDGIKSKKSTEAIREVHLKLKSMNNEFEVTYLPFRDGLVLLRYLK